MGAVDDEVVTKADGDDAVNPIATNVYDVVVKRVDVVVDNELVVDIAVAQFGRERPEAQPGGFWAGQRPKDRGRSRPNRATATWEANST